MDEQAKIAFSSAAEIPKQLITLATGLLGLEITFLKDILSPLHGDLTHTHPQGLLYWSWILLLVSIVAGVWSLMAITGTLGAEKTPVAKDIYSPNITLAMIAQIIVFLAGLVVTIWFAARL